MEVEIVEREPLVLLGVDYYGPVRSARGEETPIDTLWNRFAAFCRNRWHTIEGLVVDDEVSYEVHMWNQEELEEEQHFLAFIGIEVEKLIKTPVELVGKIIPAGRYAKITLEGEEIDNWEELVYEDWLEDSDYQVKLFGVYSLDYQRYDEDRFKGVDNLEESELDVFVPIEEFSE